jgi:pseudouridine-5'-phosphate glycosidase
LNSYLRVSDEVEEALRLNKPVVALESTIISHGMPYPQNVETALAVERIIREQCVVPATVGIIGGKLIAGLSKSEIEHMGKNAKQVRKVSRRDLPVVVSRKQDGATTVATTMIISKMAGIRFFATGGVGGVHRGASQSFDISADLMELAETEVAVISSGIKSILDIKATLEVLETQGVTVLSYGCDHLPAFYLRDSGLAVDARVDSPEELAALAHTKWAMGMKGGLLIGNPVPPEYEERKEDIDAAISQALEEMEVKHISGKEATPFLLKRVKELTNGESLNTNIQLVYSNAKLAAQVAKAYCRYL